jgi:AcrR family transcriptional regulator
LGRPKQVLSRPDTEDRLLEAAEREFASHGYEGARLHLIAEQAGISRPSLLYHFESKQQLYGTVVTRAIADLEDALRVAVGSKDDFPGRIEAVLDRFLGFLEDRPTVATVILREILDGHGPGQLLLLEAVLPLLAWLERFIREEGRSFVRTELPMRQALLQIATASLVRTACGPIRDPIWGRTDHTRELAQALLLPTPKEERT